MTKYVESEPHTFKDFQNIVHALRDPEEGCLWDKGQTHESIKKCLMDEAEEVLQAIENDDDENLCEELGDVLFMVLFHTEIAADRGAFSFDDVVQKIADKMIRRHPYVFGDEPRPETEEEALQLWKKIKQMEKEKKGIS